MYNVKDIRALLAEKYKNEDFVTDKSGVKTVEIIGTSFVADEESIFGEVNYGYVDRELVWYESQSLNVNDIPEPVPAIWKAVADKDGFINSNYGWAIWSTENIDQYDNALRQIKSNPDTRRASMIYTRPSMHNDYNKNGRSDFMCTHVVDYLVRDGKINAIVHMRSNDAWAGYRNDLAWQKHVLDKLSGDSGFKPGKIYWCAASLHVYERQFYLLEKFINADESGIPDQTTLNFA